MSRYTIDRHPDKQLIIQDIASGMYSDEKIAERYGLRDRKAVERYRNKILPEIIRLTSYRDTDSLLAAITKNIVRVDRMLEGLEKWAIDPEDQNVYAMDPRADEISVIYTKLVTQKTVNAEGKVTEKSVRIRLKENLQDVIDRCFSDFEKTGMRLETHKADQRVVLLKAMDVMGKNLQLLINARDVLIRKEGSDPSMAGIEEMLQVIQTALRPYPEAMEALVRALAPDDAKALPSANIAEEA